MHKNVSDCDVSEARAKKKKLGYQNFLISYFISRARFIIFVVRNQEKTRVRQFYQIKQKKLNFKFLKLTKVKVKDLLPHGLTVKPQNPRSKLAP